MTPSEKGKFSRNKGRREEQQLVLALAKLGYKAERVLRQYQKAEQPDVVATKDTITYTFEMKARKNSFKTIYDVYYANRDWLGVFGFTKSITDTAFAMSTDFKALSEIDCIRIQNLSLRSYEDKILLKACNRILKLQELKQHADYLVIKDNNRPRLYIRYWR